MCIAKEIQKKMMVDQLIRPHFNVNHVDIQTILSGHGRPGKGNGVASFNQVKGILKESVMSTAMKWLRP